MAFKCGECEWVIRETREYTAIEVHKLNHIILRLLDKLDAFMGPPVTSGASSS